MYVPHHNLQLVLVYVGEAISIDLDGFPKIFQILCF